MLVLARVEPGLFCLVFSCHQLQKVLNRPRQALGSCQQVNVHLAGVDIDHHLLTDPLEVLPRLFEVGGRPAAMIASMLALLTGRRLLCVIASRTIQTTSLSSS